MRTSFRILLFVTVSWLGWRDVKHASEKVLAHWETLPMFIPLLYKKLRVTCGQPRLSWTSTPAVLADFVIPSAPRAHDGPRAPLSGPLTGPVLVVGAHPDDIELGAAGAALRLAEEGEKVYGLVLTQGENGTQGPAVIREEEARAAAGVLGLKDLWVSTFPDTLLRQHIPELRDVIERKVLDLGIRVVVTHGPHETHGDHAAVFEAAREASRKCSLVCFESISAPKEFVPNFFVDITRYLSGKLEAVKLHKTQATKFYMDPDLVKGRAAHRGLQAGVRYAEAFWIYRWVQ